MTGLHGGDPHIVENHEAGRLEENSTCAGLKVQKNKSSESTECRVLQSTSSVGGQRMTYEE